MKILLTSDEYAALVPQEKLASAHEAIEAMREMLVGEKCVHGEDRTKRWTYCDRCPLSHVGDRREGRPSHVLSKEMCGLPRSYGK